MTNRTYRLLDAPLRIAGFTPWQWLGMLVGGGGVIAGIYVIGLPTKPAISLAVLLLGPPIALAYLSEDVGLDVGQLLKDALRWIGGPKQLAPGGSENARALLVAPSEQPTRRRGRASTAGDLLPIAGGPTADGLIVLDDDAFVRFVEVEAVNPLVMDEAATAEIAHGFAQVAARIAPNQSLQLYVHSVPLPVDAVVERERSATQAAAVALEQTGSSDLRRALRWLSGGHEQTLRFAADAVVASSVRYVIAATWRSSAPVWPWRRRTPAGTRSVAEVERFARLSDQAARGVVQELEGLGLESRRLDGSEVCDLLWSRFAPERADRGERQASAVSSDLVGALDDPRDGKESHAVAKHLRDVMTPEPIDGSERTHLGIGSHLEQTLYLATIPDQTWLGWLLHLMQLPKPFALTVHVHATERHRERLHHRRRYKRIYGLNRGIENRGRPLDPDAQLGEEEAAELNAELATTAGAGIYRLSVYLSVREPSGDTEVLREHVQEVVREALAVADARFSAGPFAQLALWQSTLPLGFDRARRTRKYVARNVADTLPLVGTGCGSPEGIPLGFAHPGRTLERLDPFDAEHANHLLLINGKSGTGKTMTTILLVARAMARGATGFVIDRAGHFEWLCNLVPGALSLSIGAGHEQTAVNPWDVEDPSSVDPRKVAYLLALHALLIGRHEGGEQELDALESNLLGLAIRDVYSHAARTGELPRERLLQEALYRRAEEERAAGAAEIALVLRSLAERLHHYVGDGPHAYLVDRPTSVPSGAPLVAFDTRDVPEEVAGAALFVVCEHVTRQVEARRERHLSAEHGPASWSSRSFLVIDETWKLVERRATGRWINELARRSRHLALWLIAVSQQLSDFDNEYGRALLDNASMRLFLRQDAKQLGYMREALGLTSESMQAIASLQTAKRQHSTVYLMNGTRGEGVVSIRLGAIEYWLATNDPAHDEPLRRAALRQAERDGHPPWQAHWHALRLLSDPDWHRERQKAA